MSPNREAIHKSSGNVFEDVGLPNADTHHLKAQLVAELYRLSNERGLTQAKAADLMGITQPQVSRMFKGHFREYSVERLLRFLTAFGRDIEIVSRPHTPTSVGGDILFRAGGAKGSGMGR